MDVVELLRSMPPIFYVILFFGFLAYLCRAGMPPGFCKGLMWGLVAFVVIAVFVESNKQRRPQRQTGTVRYYR